MAIESGSWWTAPTESESGRLIMVTGRKDIDNFRSNERFKIRIEVTGNMKVTKTECLILRPLN